MGKTLQNFPETLSFLLSQGQLMMDPQGSEFILHLKCIKHIKYSSHLEYPFITL